jgi:ATP-dependent RNA helicase SUPV3L1/SUV3
MSSRPTGAAPSRLVAVLGPTNTGKTHLAVERMLGHRSGMIGLPLRLLAREIYDRIVKLKGQRAVALITGEEKIIPPHAAYFVCTVEAMPLNREVEFLAIDEIQLCADRERGHVFTHRLLHARGKAETMLLGAATMGPLIRRLLPGAEFMTRERFSSLTYDGSKKLSRLPRRSAVVAFSAESVYAIAELIRRQRGGAAVVMGSLSPRTRNAQVALYQSGEVDFLVATDAIGMGLNMDVDHVAFAGLRKFDGRKTRWLHPQEVGQIAGRAGRYRKDGTFGVTGDCPEMDDDLVQAVEAHQYQPVPAAEWRASKLDFTSLKGLLRSLSTPPPHEALALSQEALDETTLRQLAQDPDLDARCRNQAVLRRLWEVAQTPDFRKVSLDEHVRLCRTLFEDLTSPRERVHAQWIAGQFKALDRTDGDIDALAGRLASVRTLAYVANRPDWLHDPKHWQATTRGLEDRLSDTLHERLMQRFIDRRTSALMRTLRVRDEPVLAGVGADGAVTVEGHFVGKLQGVGFEPAAGSSTLEEKALRMAAQRAVAPEVAKRLGQLAADGDDAFGLLPDGSVCGAAQSPGASRAAAPSPRACASWASSAPPGARTRRPPARGLRRRPRDPGARPAQAPGRRHSRRHAQGPRPGRRLPPRRVRRRHRPPPARCRSHRSLPRRAPHAPQLRPPIRRAQPVPARPAVRRGSPRRLRLRRHRVPGLAAEPAGLTPLATPAPSARTLAAFGLRAAGPFAAPVLQLERLDERLRAAPHTQRGTALPAEALAELGWTEAEAAAVLRGLGFAPSRPKTPDEPVLWRQRRAAPKPVAKPEPVPGSPFAALAAWTPPAPARKPRRAPADAARLPQRERARPLRPHRCLALARAVHEDSPAGLRLHRGRPRAPDP